MKASCPTRGTVSRGSPRVGPGTDKGPRRSESSSPVTSSESAPASPARSTTSDRSSRSRNVRSNSLWVARSYPLYRTMFLAKSTGRLPVARLGEEGSRAGRSRCAAWGRERSCDSSRSDLQLMQTGDAVALTMDLPSLRDGEFSESAKEAAADGWFCGQWVLKRNGSPVLRAESPLGGHQKFASVITDGHGNSAHMLSVTDCRHS